MTPLVDRRGRLSVLKATTFALLFAPILWLGYLGLTDGLTPLPWVFSIYYSGLWSLWYLLASLAVTPIRAIFGWRELIRVRRMLGVAGLAYALLHVFVYVGLDRFNLPYIVNEFGMRATVWVATFSTLGLIVLGATSFDDAIRKLGARAWNRLHLLAYPAIGLAVLHFDMSPGSFGGAPFLITGLYFWLMAWRVLDRFDRGMDPAALAALALVSTLVSFAFEVTWLALYQGIRAGKTLAFTFDIVGGLAATWQVLIIGLSTALIASLFGRRRRWRADARPDDARRAFQPT